MRKSVNKKALAVRISIIFSILLCLNILSTRFSAKIDATKEKRYSLSAPTIKLLKSLKDEVLVQVYLKGSFPAGFQKLSEATNDLLTRYRDYSGQRVRFEFINPMEGKTDDEKKQMYESLSKLGINPVNLQVQQDGEDGYSEKIIFPWAKVTYNQKEQAVNLLENHIAMSPSEKLNNAETMLEYKFSSAIKNLMLPDKKKVAYLVGNEEIIGNNTLDILNTLGNLYDLDTIDLNKTYEIPKYYAAAIVAKPRLAFDDKNKFKLDQYIMQGGNMFWCIDPLNFTLDSLTKQEAGLAMDLGLNLDDLLFQLGARINSDLIEDFQHPNLIPVTIGYNGDNPDIRMLPWLYNFFSISTSKHPIVNNLDAVMFILSSSIDTVSTPNASKSVLLHSSPRSRMLPAPVRVSLSGLRFKPDASQYKKKDIPLAILSEGNYNSIFTNRLDPAFIKVYKDSLKKEFYEKSIRPSKQIVVSDGDILINDFSQSRGPLECGFYKYTEQQFANKTFVLNCLEYLTDDFGILEARNKNLTLRLLDSARIKKEKLQWQIFNIGLPLILVFIFASGYFFFRRKKYEGKIV